ncbi:MAG TPA: hypothetical protein VEK11_08055 [Thermoanaerobaculia bacterium]|nr:hypothetical protein [Thermoanaerobaculia bacterium]
MSGSPRSPSRWSSHFPRSQPHRCRFERDLRGQWIHAVSWAIYAYNWDDFARGTSELSVPLPVE